MKARKTFKKTIYFEILKVIILLVNWVIISRQEKRKKQIQQVVALIPRNARKKLEEVSLRNTRKPTNGRPPNSPRRSICAHQGQKFLSTKLLFMSCSDTLESVFLRISEIFISVGDIADKEVHKL